MKSPISIQGRFEASPYSRGPRTWLKVLVALVTMTAAFVCSAGVAHASHFRYGTIGWDVPDPINAPRAVRFNVISAWRAGSLGTTTTLDFGDGANNGPVQGAQVGTGTDSIGNGYVVFQYTATHTYATAGTFTAQFTGCCRIVGLQNGANGNYTVQTIVSLAGGNTAGPVSGAPPIIELQAGAPRTYDFPMFDADGDVVTCRFATAAESGLPAGQTIPAVPIGGAQPTLASNANTCRMTWDLTQAIAGQQYVVHYVVSSTHAGVVSSSAVDLMVEIVSAPPGTCAGTGFFTTNVGVPFTHTTTATWSTGGNAAVSLINPPTGATLTPPVASTRPSPFSTLFSWTPTLADLGTSRVVIVNYTAPNNISTACFLTLNVPQCPVCAGTTPVCNPSTRTCVPCNPGSPSDCPAPSVCAASGGNAGACVECTTNAQCGGAKPICNTTSNVCVACNGDNGTGTSFQCPTPGAPWCAPGGACAKCTGDADCGAGHAGPFCNVATGACGNTCFTDAECGAGNWCNDLGGVGTGVCQPKVPNPQPVPGGTCTATIGGRACVSGVCDTDNRCGYLNGDGPCNGVDGTIVCRSQVCVLSGVNSGKCEECAGDSNCKTPTPACDASNKCVQCTKTNGSECKGTTPVCSSAETCAACNGDNGSGATNACPGAGNPFCEPDGSCAKCTSNTDCTTGTHGGPICNRGTGSCGNTCTVDSDCPSTQWCNNLGGPGQCQPKVPNGDPVPGGTCTTTLGGRACVSAVCDTKDNRCGYLNGDGPCSGTTGGVVCRSKICATTGGNANLCVACIDDSSCASPTPACDTKNACVQCRSGNTAACANPKPVCDTTSEACVPCDGDLGDPAAKEPCSSTGAPTCTLTGTGQGSCGKCTSSTDCTGHPLGTICDTTTGSCGKTCRLDTDCNTTTQWCNAPSGGTGTCTAKIPNGDPLPTAPPEVTTCTAAVGTRVCVSATCDPKDNRCGLPNGTGPCTKPADCRSNICDPDGKCGKQDGESCGGLADCRSGVCNGGICAGAGGGADGGAGNGAAADNGKLEGGGLSCATTTVTTSSEAPSGVLLGLGVTALALGLRRRRRDRKAA